MVAGELRLGARSLSRRLLAHGGVVFVVLVGLGFADAGLLPRTWRLASIGLLGLVAAALVTGAAAGLRRIDAWIVAAYAALVAWTALSAAWSTRPTASLLQGERVLVYAAAMLAFLLLAEEAALRHVLVGALAATAVIVTYALVRYVVAPPPLDQFEGRLLYQPFGYANALGIFAAIGILLAVGLALCLRATTARAAALAPIAVLAPALYLTSSRGAWVALVAGLVVLAVLRGGTRTATAVGAVATVAVVAVTIALSLNQLSVARLAGENRPQYWHVALRDYRDHPVLGSGAGTYGDYWLRHRPVQTFTRTAHSLYLQSLAELGPLGFGLVVAALALPLVALRRRRDPLVATAAAGYVAYLVHTGVDWDWELPAVTLAGLVCGAVLLRSRRDGAVRELSPRSRAGLLAAALVLACLELVRLVTGPATPFGV